MIIDVLPVWALFLVTAALVLLSVEVGLRLGRRVRQKTDAERESPVSAISGSILGLQAFMLAFTFSIVSDLAALLPGIRIEWSNGLHVGASRMRDMRFARVK